MSNSGRRDNATANHLDDIDDGAGCTEIWERMTDIRAPTEDD